jgi:hypothetical protein
MEKKLITNVKFEGIDHKDYPDYCDAYIVSADYNGVPMNDEQIEELAQDTGLVYDLLIEYLY